MALALSETMGPHPVEVAEIDCRHEVDESQPLPSSYDLVQGGMNGFGHFVPCRGRDSPP